MNRRHFLASAAATAIAPSCLAQPATVFETQQWASYFVVSDTSRSEALTAHLADAMRRTKEMVGASAFMQGARP